MPIPFVVCVLAWVGEGHRPSLAVECRFHSWCASSHGVYLTTSIQNKHHTHQLLLLNVCCACVSSDAQCPAPTTNPATATPLLCFSWPSPCRGHAPYRPTTSLLFNQANGAQTRGKTAKEGKKSANEPGCAGATGGTQVSPVRCLPRWCVCDLKYQTQELFLVTCFHACKS